MLRADRLARGRWTPAAVLGLTLVVIAAAPRPAASQTPKQEVDPDHAAKMAKGLALFKQYVKPILVQNCVRCHGGKAVESELDLSDRDSLLKGGQHGPVIVPGKSQDSLLVKLITHQREPHMPKVGGKLSDAAVAHIKTWIDLGAPYDAPLVARRAKSKSWTERVLPADARQFWSFEPLARAGAPAVNDGGWSRTPVDRFIFARLQTAGLTPNPRASKQALIRRAYFDLVGLPPTPEAVEAFLMDDSPEAYAHLVDKLLASPHHGERWARHWLDLARFAESHGFEHDYDRPSAYHYRDFVIEALNRDLPFDTFVKWQIAGDEYEPENPLALKATGFLAAGVHSTQITKSEVEKHRYDEMDDKLSTLTTAFLGLTVGCARCHDHKYDPIPQRDYYRLLSTFTTTVRSEIDLNLDPQGYKQAKANFDKAHAPYESAVRQYEAEELPKRIAEWEQGVKLDTITWETLEPHEMKSKEGATLTRASDGSILATGNNAKFDTYTFTARTTLAKIHAVRLEALAHPSLVKGGPGRAGNGNFALTDFRVEIAGPKGDKAVPVKFATARATFEQKGLPVQAAIDNDAKSAWAIDPAFGKDNAAVFELAAPEKATQLVFTLKFENNDGHNLGRLRLSVSGVKAPDLAGPGIPAKVRELLGIAASQRSAAQTATALNWYRTIDAGWRALNGKREEHLAKAPQAATVKCLVATEGLPAVRLHTQGEDFFPETFFLRRGDPDNKEGVAPQGFLQVLMPSADAVPQWQSPPPSGWRTSYRRRALAEWLTDTEKGAGRLLARVIVNRLWQHHMGRGIVATPSDFGIRGERPTHPELLDYLAAELIKGGWRLRPIHKLIMTSAVYQQGAQVDAAKTKLDRDNKLWWRFPARRLEAEVIRDTLLAVSGQLDDKMFGPGTLDEASKRRSIYFTVKRSKLVPMMVIFDAPEALGGMAERPTTTIAPQALHLLNSPQVRQCARAFARRVAPADTTPVADAVRHAYRIALAREPSETEALDAQAFLQQQMATYAPDRRRDAALTDFCQVLMCLNEFIYVD
jgi:mono/diheme cytochrome c family protein